MSASFSISLSLSLSLPRLSACSQSLLVLTYRPSSSLCPPLTPAPPLVHVRSQGCVASAHITPNNVTNSIRPSVHPCSGLLVLRGALLRCTSKLLALHTLHHCTALHHHSKAVAPAPFSRLALLTPPLSCKRSPTRGKRRQQ